MAIYVHMNVPSRAMRMAADVSVLIPDVPLKRDPEKGCQKFQTLYLLHGFTGDHLSWLRGTSIERYADEHQILTVMPSAYNSAYTDMKYGLPYFTYISEELPEMVERLFPSSPRRQDRFVSGMSMGGYGAYKLGLSCPDRFAAIGGIAGSYHAEYRYQGKVSTVATLCEALYGDPPQITPEVHDIFTMLENLKKSGADIPRLYTCCGTEDRRHQDSVDLKEFADRIGVPLTFEEGHGQHNNEYFDKSICRVLEWMEPAGQPVYV